MSSATVLLAPAWYDVLWTLGAGLAVLVPVAVAVWLVVRLARRASPAPDQALAAARRHAAAISATATGTLVLCLLVALPAVAARPVDLLQGLLYGLVPAGAGAAFAVVHAIGEHTWPRPTGPVRRAPLVRRTTADVAPRRIHRVAHATALLLTVTLLVCGLVADGRAITHTVPQGSSSAGPFPGWYYGVPLLAATALVVLATEWALSVVARRPAVVGVAHEDDLLLRRVSAQRLLQGCQAVLGMTATGVLLVAGSASLRVGSAISTLPDSSSPGHLVGGGLALVAALAVVGATLVVLGTPSPALPRTRTGVGATP